MEDWKVEAEKYRDEGMSWNQLGEIMQPFFPNLNSTQVREKVRTYLRRKEGKKEKEESFDIIDILKKGTTLKELSEKLKVSEKACRVVIEDIKEQGHNVLEVGEEIKISNIILPEQNKIVREWDGNKIIRFGLMGDTQINSKYTQITHLHKLYDIYEQEGIEDVYHTGDIDEGEQMRVGHQYECYTQGADDHVNEIIRVYPKRKGITTHFITGNHDASIIKRCGYDIGYPIAKARDDMEYLGNSNATIYLTPNCTLELRHPIDGTAYATSYKTQKMIEAFSGGEKPNILAVGHYHKTEYLFYRNVHCFQTGSFQAQTPWMRGKGIAAAVGGWIVEIHVDEDGTIQRLKQEYIPFYKSIQDDYRNWR